MAYTRAQVATLIRQRCDIENTTAQVDSEINNHINDAAAYVHDFLIGTLGERYAVAVDGFPTIAGAEQYSLTSFAGDFYRLLSMRLEIDDESFPLESFSELDTVLRLSGQPWGSGYLPRYRVQQDIDGIYKVSFDPPPDAVHTIGFRYHTTAPTYSSDAAVVAIPNVDLLITEACIRVKMKEERDASLFLNERAAIQKRIEDWVGSIDNGNVRQTLIIPRNRRAAARRGRLF